MKIAVTYENGQVFAHFGKTKRFELFCVQDGKLAAGEFLDVVGEGHGALAGLLKEHGVDTLICGGLGAGARTSLAEAGIAVYPGVAGPTKESAQALLDGTLRYDPDTACDHHHEGAEQGEHGCGHHH